MTLTFPIARFVGDLVGVLGRNWMSLVLVLLVVGVTAYFAPGAHDRTPQALIAVGLASRALTGLMTLAVTVIVLRDRLGWPGGPVEALRRAAPVVLTAIALILLRDLPAFAMVLPIAIALKARPDNAVGLIDAIIGAQVFALAWAFAFNLLFGGALAAALAERRSLRGALVRSFRVTAGRRVILAGLFVAVVMVVALAEFAFSYLFNAAGPLSSLTFNVVGVLTLAVRLVAAGLAAATLATLFLDLRRLADPAPIEAAAVVD